MDVKMYFRKMREIEASLTEAYVVVASLETPDGGRPGTLCEVSRENAARMIVEGRAVVASPEQVDELRARQAAARKAAEQADLAKRIQFAIVSDSDNTHSPVTKRGVVVPSGK